ncbi:hypothetical protein QTO34_018155 [Cnephaeus nilssonii]|uniref:PIMREG n=1 Tax=Cnephaeus nilssonii TaxID=3371016 RepID=A0AA40LPX2_CNENI|nr:hypothetical protein QTO34_018155 [Eptesicus nilssonii]
MIEDEEVSHHRLGPQSYLAEMQEGERDQEQLEENEVLQPAFGLLETSSIALASVSRQLQRRLPLRAVSLNLGPSWKHLETPEPRQQGLQAAAGSDKNTLGAMSQRIQESCQGGTKWRVKARRRKRETQKVSSPPARSLSQRSTRLSGTTPARSTLGPITTTPHGPLWSESDSDLEPLGAAIQCLQKLSQEWDEAMRLMRALT